MQHVKNNCNYFQIYLALHSTVITVHMKRCDIQQYNVLFMQCVDEF